MKAQIEKFCSIHNACQDGREGAVKNCQTMREAWDKARPDWVVWIATRHGVLTDKELRLFAVFCAREALALLPSPDPRSVEAVNVAERHANGQATDAELSAAARFDELIEVAAVTDYDAAYAARTTAYFDAYATKNRQADYLRTNCNPTF
jgi:hypothetical protein